MKRNTKRTKKTQACVGCGDPFTTFKNYDYCVDCAINGNRYLVKSNCSECDGSGWIKFKHQPKRPCKLCYLTKTPMKNQLTKEERYWDQVDQLAQEKIYQLFTTNIPFQNIKLITEPWKFEDRQQKLSGLFLDRDVDYRTLLTETESQWYERVQEDGEELPTIETMAEEIALWYCQMVIKSLIRDLSDYSSYDPSFFSGLTTNEY